MLTSVMEYMLTHMLLFIAALFAGAINAVAGGGTFFAFPALLLTGASSIAANVTCTIALWPGSVASAYAYRGELQSGNKVLFMMGGIGIAGGLVGALILLRTPEKRFDLMIPWLLLGATLLFAFGRQLAASVNKHMQHATNNITRIALSILFQIAISLYGGFFGAGIGILTLAMLYIISPPTLHMHQLNALKTLLASAINASAFALFLFSGKVLWLEGAIMMTGGICGGYLGARLSLSRNPDSIRRFVLIVASLMTAYFFVKTYS